jgi:hypothetical protein
LLVVLASLAAVALLATGLPAQAHEGAKVGKYLFTVGFGTEPACLGRLNSVQLVLEDAARKSVTDLGDTPQVGVTAESVPGQMRLRLEPNVRVGEFGTRRLPGVLRADQPGQLRLPVRWRDQGAAGSTGRALWPAASRAPWPPFQCSGSRPATRRTRPCPAAPPQPGLAMP